MGAARVKNDCQTFFHRSAGLHKVSHVERFVRRWYTLV